MTMPTAWIGMAVVILLASSGSAAPPEDAASADGPQRKFMGTGKCKTCHKKPEQGQQYVIWSKTRHAKAYETLATDKAKEYGKERGVDDPQTSDKCLKCHVTAHGVDAEYLGTKYKATDGVGCESCHGPGGDYYKKSTMKALVAGGKTPESVGLTIPDEETCVRCHNDESPAFKGFDFEKAFKKIEHPIPAEKKASYKEASG